MILLTPVFVNLIPIYAICNIHDITWGNRPTYVSGGNDDKIDISYGPFETIYKKYILQKCMKKDHKRPIALLTSEYQNVRY